MHGANKERLLSCRMCEKYTAPASEMGAWSRWLESVDRMGFKAALKLRLFEQDDGKSKEI